MKLWIRSQEKTRLIKADNILAYKFDDGSYGIQINGECFVGDYKTRRRALEVLDEIQNVILYSGIDYNEIKKNNINTKSWFGTNLETGVSIYEMPEE